MDIFKKLKSLEYYPLSAKPLYLIRTVQAINWMNEDKENNPKTIKSLCFLIYYMMSMDSEDIDTNGIDILLTQFGGFESLTHFIDEYLKLSQPFQLDFEPVDYYNLNGLDQFILHYGLDDINNEGWPYEGDCNIVSRTIILLKFFRSLDIIVHSCEPAMLCDYKQINNGLFPKYNTDQECQDNFITDIITHLPDIELMYLDLVNCNVRCRLVNLTPFTHVDKKMMKRFTLFFKKQVRSANIPLKLYFNWLG